ncbi:MFS transporter [Arthrobacter sp. TMN-49]
MTQSPQISYQAVLSRPQVPLRFGAALAGRLAYPLVFIPLLLAIEASTGSFAVAGAAVGVYGATAGFLAPLRAKAIDRYGQRRTLPILAFCFSALLVATSAITATAGSSALLCVVMAGLVGAVAPPLGPVMRVLWKQLTEGPVMLKRALTLDAVIEEVLYLIGPAVAGLLVTLLPASAVLLLPAVLVSAGTVGMMAAGTLGAPPGVSAGRIPHAIEAPQKRLTSRSFLSLLSPVLGIGVALGVIYVAVPAFGHERGNVAATGLILAAFAAGSALGGMLYGRLEWTLSPLGQLPLLAAGVAVGAIAMAVAPGVITLGILAAVTGLFLSPAMISAYFAASKYGPSAQATEVNTWVNTSQNIGAAAGSALAGILIERSTTSTSFVSAGVAALALIVAGMFLSRQIGSGKRTSPRR